MLVTGRELYSFNAGTMSGRAATASLTGGTVPEISPDDAARLGIVDAGRASVRSRYGETVLSCRISERLQPGMVFATFSDPALPVNNLTGPGRDPETHTPEYKVTAVSVECAEHDSGSNGCPGRVEGPYGGLTVSPYVSDRRHPRLVRIKEES